MPDIQAISPRTNGGPPWKDGKPNENSEQQSWFRTDRPSNPIETKISPPTVQHHSVPQSAKETTGNDHCKDHAQRPLLCNTERTSFESQRIFNEGLHGLRRVACEVTRAKRKQDVALPPPPPLELRRPPSPPPNTALISSYWAKIGMPYLEQLKCNVPGCGAKFTGVFRETELRSHKINQHSRLRQTRIDYRCEAPACGETFRTEVARFVHYQEEHPEHAREFELKQMETTMSAVDRDEHEAVMNTRVPAPTMIHQPMISVAAYGSSSSVC